MPAVSLGEIVDLVGGEFAGDRDHTIKAVSPLVTAAADQLSFLSNRKYLADLNATRAGAVLVFRRGPERSGLINVLANTLA